MRLFSALLAALSIPFFLTACSPQNGAIAGRVNPPVAGVLVTVLVNGKAAASVPADEHNGGFSVPLRPGVYDVAVSVPGGQFPVRFAGIRVQPEITTDLPPIEIPATPSGKFVLSGRAVPDATVTLYQDGQERATVNTAAKGNYTFTELGAGSYVIEAKAPGYAPDSIPVILADRAVTADIALLYKSPVQGVDWAGGKITVTGVGVPPANAANATVRRELAKRAALADAERKLVNLVAAIKVAPDQTVKSHMGEKNFTRSIEGFVKGYHISAERESNQGRIEIDLELPLTGQNGLSRYLAN